jgi:hypothetical protein
MSLNVLKNIEDLPKSASLIEAGNGPIWQYDACCIENVWVRGGITSFGENWLTFNDLRGLHNAIADHFLSLDAPMKAEVFRFLRKEMLLTAKEAAELVGTLPDVIFGWEAGDRFSNGHPAERLREIYLRWRQTGVRPTIGGVSAVA